MRCTVIRGDAWLVLLSPCNTFEEPLQPRCQRRSLTRTPAGWCYAAWLLCFPFDGAWSLVCGVCRSFVLIAGVARLLYSLAVPGVWGFLRVTPHLQLASIQTDVQ